MIDRPAIIVVVAIVVAETRKKNKYERASA